MSMTETPTPAPTPIPILSQHELRKRKWEREGDTVGNYRVVCAHCQKEAFKRHPTAKFCGIDCQEKHRYERLRDGRSAPRLAVDGEIVQDRRAQSAVPSRGGSPAC